MQREIGDEIRLGSTVSPFDNIGLSSAITEQLLTMTMRKIN